MCASAHGRPAEHAAGIHLIHYAAAQQEGNRGENESEMLHPPSITSTH